MTDLHHDELVQATRQPTVAADVPESTQSMSQSYVQLERSTSDSLDTLKGNGQVDTSCTRRARGDDPLATEAPPRFTVEPGVENSRIEAEIEELCLAMVLRAFPGAELISLPGSGS